MKKWDDVKYLYYNIAAHYLKSFPEYQADELVNEAWIMTYPFLDNEHLANKIHQKIMGYIRFQKRQRVGGHVNQKFSEMGIVKWSHINDDNYISINEFIGYEIETCDFIKEKAKKLNMEEKIILYLKFEYDMHLDIIGKLFNVTGERIRQKLYTIFDKMRTND